tara:strand:- start:42 stop:458 length:417 start_codon:yes stop_codon:yes gene_type:complete
MVNLASLTSRELANYKAEQANIKRNKASKKKNKGKDKKKLLKMDRESVEKRRVIASNKRSELQKAKKTDLGKQRTVKTGAAIRASDARLKTIFDKIKAKKQLTSAETRIINNDAQPLGIFEFFIEQIKAMGTNKELKK